MPSLTILVVEDSEDDLETWVAFLSKCPDFKASILTAGTAEEALAQIATKDIDCALIDHGLPDLSGTTLLDALSEASEGVIPFPVIVLTGEGSEELAVLSIQKGASDYIAKRNVTENSLNRAILNAQQKHILALKVAEKRSELEFFAARIAHDLKAPLQRIAHYGDLIDRKALEDPSVVHDYVGRIVDDSRFAVQFINDLLDYSRNTFRSDKNLKPVCLNHVLRRVTTTLEHDLRDKGAFVEIDSSLPQIKGCETSLVQLFQNLFENALKYNTSPYPRILIHQIDKGKEMFRLSFQDNGIGVDPRFLEAIFKPLCRLHTRDTYPGTGIGLAMCQLIVEQHKGKISAESDGCSGTTFMIDFPKNFQ